MKKFCLQIRLTVSLILISFCSTYGQDDNPLTVKIVPPSPEATAIEKFVDMPASPYTGLPKIDIPIYELKSWELSLPISLSYHASGVKMEELASSVGAGWTLNAGGIVSRTIRGFYDEFPNKGYLSTIPSSQPYAVASFFNANGTVNGNFFDQNVKTVGGGQCQGSNGDGYNTIFYASRGGLDLEPDLFFFSLPDGQSGKFVFDRAGAIHMIPKQHADITYTMDPNGNNRIGKWVIVGKDGTKYIFSAMELSSSVNECTEPTGLNVEMGQPDLPLGTNNGPTSWRLSKIASASGLDTIFFDYESEVITYEFTNSLTTYDPFSGSFPIPAPNTCASQLSVTSMRLKQIRSLAGYKVFFNDVSRQDIQGAKAVSKITVSYNGAEIKSYTLGYDYVGTGDFEHKMLMLSSIRESKGTNFLPPYDFTYYTNESFTGFHRANPNIDHWGYSNGQTGNTHKSPQMIYENVFYGGANREPNLEYGRQWSLKEIKYPTGGRTEYEYELNDFSNIPAPETQPFNFITGLQELASIEFAITSNINDDYSGSDGFTLPSAANVIYVYTIPEIPGGGIPASGCNGTLSCPSPTFTKYFNITGPTNQPIESLAAGTYTLTAEFDPSDFEWYGLDLSTLTFSIKVYKVPSQSELVQNSTLKGGGLRIKKITSYGDNTITKSYGYTYQGSQVSSGKLASFPSYAYFLDFNDGGAVPGTCNITQSATMIVRTATSNLPLTLSQGGYVGYDVVTEYVGTAQVNNGYTVYKYDNNTDGLSSTMFPIIPNVSYSYKNGLLKEQVDYTTDGKLVKYTSNTYRFLDPETVSYGIKVAQAVQTGCRNCENRTFSANYYNHYTERVELGETTARIYDIHNDNYQEQKITFNYDQFDQVDYTEETTSIPGKKLFNKFEYHPTFHNAVTKKYSYYSSNTTSPREYKAGQLIIYNNFVKPQDVRILEAPQGAVSGEPTPFVSRLVYDDFDAHGNVESYLKDGSELTRTSLIWGYNDLVPTAQVVGAPKSKIAYTSFETHSNEGGWKFGSVLHPTFFTGEYGYSSLGSTPIETDNKDLVAGTYILSFWSTNSNFTITYDNGSAVTQSDYLAPTTQGLWTLYTKKLDIAGTARELKISRTGSADITIDDLRLYPLGSLMTTYAYNMVTGITATTDANNFTSYYLYDSHNRLYQVKDFEGNILKQIEYHYERDNN